MWYFELLSLSSPLLYNERAKINIYPVATAMLYQILVNVICCSGPLVYRSRLELTKPESSQKWIKKWQSHRFPVLMHIRIDNVVWNVLFLYNLFVREFKFVGFDSLMGGEIAICVNSFETKPWTYWAAVVRRSSCN